MRNLIRKNPTLGKFVPWLIVVGLYGFIQSYLFYYYASNGLDFAPLCGSSFLAGWACLIISIRYLRAARGLLPAKKLDIQLAKNIVYGSITINSVYILLGQAFSIVGIYPDIGDTPGEFISGFLIDLVLFFLWNILALINNLRALALLRQQPIEISSSECVTSEQIKNEIINSADISFGLFDEVWIGSREHLKKWTECVTSTPESSRKDGYNIPEGFPYVIVRKAKIPGVTYCRGILAIGKKEIIFKAISEYPRWGIIKVKLFNLDEDYEFNIKINEITALDWFKYSDGARYDFDWIEIKTKSIELLLVAGGYGPNIEKIKKRTQELFEKINHVWQSG